LKKKGQLFENFQIPETGRFLDFSIQKKKKTPQILRLLTTTKSRTCPKTSNTQQQKKTFPKTLL
jgi:hypothetical protein